MELRPFYRLRCSGAKSSATAVSAQQGGNAVSESAIPQAMERRGLTLLMFTSRKMLALSSGKEIGHKSCETGTQQIYSIKSQNEQHLPRPRVSCNNQLELLNPHKLRT